MADREVKIVYRITDDGTIRVLDTVERKVRDVGEAGERSATRAAGGFSRMQASIVSLNQAAELAGRIIGGTFRGIERVIGQSLDRLDDITKLSRGVGLSVKELSSFRLAADLSGVSLQQLSTSLGIFSKRLVESSDPTTKIGRAFQELGIEAKGTLPTLLDLADAFQALPDGAEKVALAREAFGRSGALLISLLNQGSDAIRAQIVEAERLGIVFDTDVGEAAELVNDNMRRLQLAVEGLGQSVAIALLPELTRATNETVAWAEANREVVSSGLVGFIRDVKDAFAGLQAIGDLPVWRQLRELNLFLASGALESVAALGRSDFETGTGRIPPFEINERVREVAARLGENDAAADRIAKLREILASEGRVGGGAGRAAGGRSAADQSVADAARQAAELEQRIGENILERERQQLALLDAQVASRDRAIDFAKEQLAVAQDRNESEAAQVALAEELDALERQRLLAMRERIETEIDGLLQFGPIVSSELVKLGTELDDVNVRLARGPEHAQRLREEFERTGGVVEDLGETLNRSLQRAVDGFFNSGGIGQGDVVVNTLRATLSQYLGDSLESVLGGGGLNGLLSGEGFGAFSQLFGGAELVGPPTAAAAAQGATSLGAAGGAGGALGAIPIIGAAIGAVQLIGEVVQGFKAGFKAAGNRAYERGVSSFELSGTAFSQDPAGQLWSGILGEEIGGNLNYAILTGGIGHIMDALGIGLFQPKTAGTILKREYAGLFRRANLPTQRGVDIEGRTGVRVPGLESAPTLADRDELIALGFPSVGGISRVGLRNRLQAAGAERPEVEAFREAEALGLASVLGRSPQEAASGAQVLTNNLLLLGVNAEEARRQLQRLAESAGVDLVNGLDELNKKFLQSEKSEKALSRLQAGAEGLVKLFVDDLPPGVDALAILAENLTATGGLSVGEFIKDLERAVEIFGQLEATAEGGLRTGLTDAGAALARRNALLAGGGSVSDIIRANLDAQDAITETLQASLSQGVQTAIVEGVFDAVQDTPAWEALSEAIADAVTGGDLTAIPDLIGNVVDASLPVLNAAFEGLAELSALAGVTPSQLSARGRALDTQARDFRFNQLSPRDQERRLTEELGGLDTQIAGITANGITAEEALVLEPLLARRGEIGSEFLNLAGGYAQGSARYNDLASRGLTILDSTADRYIDFGISQRDALSAATSATQDNSAATETNSEAVAQNTTAVLKLTETVAAGVAVTVLGDPATTSTRTAPPATGAAFTQALDDPLVQRKIRSFTRER